MLCTFTAALMADSLKSALQNGLVSRCLHTASTMCMGRLSLPLKYTAAGSSALTSIHMVRLHGELAANVVRDSASAVQKEMLEAYALIERLGRGVVYYGSARLKSSSAHWGRAQALGRDVARLLGCTTWSGGGPGMMEAATLGAPLLPA